MENSVPRKLLMQEREVVTIPAERVAIDLVRPFPTAKGTFKYILTYVNVATRLPEAITLGMSSSKVMIKQLTNIFSRCVFPKALVSDDRPQFTASSH